MKMKKRLGVIILIILIFVAFVVNKKNKIVKSITYQEEFSNGDALKMMLEGKSPFREMPTTDIMLKVKPIKNLDDKFVYKYINVDFTGREQDLKTFSPYFRYPSNVGREVISFPNKKKVVMLVVPTPKEGKDFRHLTSFLNSASSSQISAFWKETAKVVIKTKTDCNTVFLSTHGFGVIYLHMRIKTSNDYGYPMKFNT